MSFDNFYFRKSLYKIGQTLGRADLSNLVFLCDNDLPRTYLEKIETAFELFCALEEANQISCYNDSKLRTLLTPINKLHLLEKNPLNRSSDPLIQTDRGGRLPDTAEVAELRAFLVPISNNMSKRDLRNLICFVYDLIPQTCTLTDMDKVASANVVFKALIDDRLIGPKNLNMLKEIFEVIGRNDLCQKIQEFTSCHRPVTEGIHPPHPNSLSMSSQPSYSHSSSSSSGNYSPSTPYSPQSSMGRVSIDHGQSQGLPLQQHPPPQPLPNPVQPVQAGMADHQINQPQQGGQPAYVYHKASTPVVSSPAYTPGANVVPSMGVVPGGSPYHAVPQSESIDPRYNPATPMGGHAQPHYPNGNNMYASQFNRDLLAELKEKERLLQEGDQMKTQLLTTMEFQRELMTKLMAESGALPNPSPSPPPVNQQQQQSRKYPMSSAPHGLAIVIGNEIFNRNSKRPNLLLNKRNGSQVDVANFKNIFGILNYDVRTSVDLRSNEIDSLFDNIAATDHSHYDSFVMCITSHGESNSFIFGSDSISLDLYHLIKKIQACKSLANKPKLFFIQACRLPSEDFVSSDSGGKIDFSHNSDADLYIAWATSRDQAAYRSPSEGSWFVAALAHVFAANAQHQDLVTMMYDVTNMVSEAEGHERGSRETVQQCVETSSQLRGAVRFFP